MMDLTQLANLGEFIGGIGSAVGAVAVLATLTYLALQVRQNTSAIRASSAQAFADSINRINMRNSESLDHARIARLCFEDPETLTDDEKTLVDWMCLSACRAFETALLHVEMGSLDRETAAMLQKTLGQMFETEVYRDWWMRNPFAFTDRFVRFVEVECGVASQNSL